MVIKGNRNSSVVCLGELLIDFFCTNVGTDLVKGQNFEKQAGGAPANVCATIVKLGGSALFSGKVGNDPFGHFLKNTLEEVGVDTSMLLLDENNLTTLAFVSLKENGERDFIFNRGADANLKEDEIDKEKMSSASILHFGSATALLEEPFQSTYLNSICSAKKEGQFISFDPNYRADLWKGKVEKFVELAKEGISSADFVKVSNDELNIISGEDEIANGVQRLHRLGANTVAVTLGKNGTLLSNGKEQQIIPSIKVKSIDSTGAGDAFVGAMLFQFSKENEPKTVLEDFERLIKMTLISNKVGAVVCTRLGAITAIPTLEEVI
ncbi:fructokinase [Evansella vedderi]|uniref:Fructokinase n=1 Tax=Evansella vedderi TaxID=38282 RepID=A0ABU0A0P0_9BACI|nr:carbohydrate kinase [Evansella vedderi]MDQ0257058.1 fructokinase [Evansella vedderi]